MMIAIPAPQRERMSAAGIWLLAALISAVVGGSVAYYSSTQSNTKMVFQQQLLSDVAQLQATGAALDGAVRQLSDALVAQEGVELARKDLRAAIASHSSLVFSLRDDMPAADYDRYMQKLVELRGHADGAKTPYQGVAVWQSTVDAISQREALATKLSAKAKAA